MRIDRVTTKSGDNGETSLGRGVRVSKTDIRVELLGKMESSNTALGLAYVKLREVKDHNPAIADEVRELINQFFNIGAYIATEEIKNIDLEGFVRKIEELATTINKDLKPLNSFILPTNGEVSVLFSLARTSFREAEVLFWRAQESLGGIYSPALGRVLNRVTDLLFIISRVTSQPEELWKPSV